MAVRSKQLAAGQSIASGFRTIYTVPSGVRTIVRSIHLGLQSGSGVVVHISLLTAGGSTVYLKSSGTAAASFYLLWDAWSVMHVGDSIRIYTDSSQTLQYWASGAELVL